ncbi:MAG: hypothetical protein KF830_16045 [Planctomycetes bacterium]|nr:hypothetical protein [Planctomycetota bacterium]
MVGDLHAAITGAAGSGSFFFRYHHVPSQQPLGIVEVRTVAGSITRLERYSTYEGSERFRPVEEVDPYDNRTTYLYDTEGRVARIQRPNGIDEVWNYAPSWIGSQGWDPALYSGVEVTFEDATQPAADLSAHTYCMLFERLREDGVPVPAAKPFAGDRLLRVYNPKGQMLEGPPAAGTTYALPSGPVAERHPVFETTYWPGTDRVHTIRYFLATGPELAAVQTEPVDVAKFTYVLAGGQYRVATEHLPLRNTTHTFAYTWDSKDRVDSIVRTDDLGGQVLRTFDDQGRVLQVTITPPHGTAGRPRASDPDNGGWVEPTAMTWLYQYSSCLACDKPIVVEQQPANRRDEYDYDPVTGLLLRHRTNDPRGLPGLVQTEYVWEPCVAGDVHGAYRLKSVRTPDNSQWDYTYVTVPRATPPDRVSWGVKTQTVTVTSPSVQLADGSQATLTSQQTFDITAPPSQGRQVAFVGQLVEELDQDAVTTRFEYDAFGYPERMIRNPSGGDAEITTTFANDRLGRVVAVTENAGSSLPRQTTITRDAMGKVVGVASVVGNQMLAEQFYYDLWGNLAVRLRSNQDSAGQAPDDFGSPARTEVARAWLRDEWHYEGERLTTRLIDRRALDRDEASGPVADGVDARYLREDYFWLPNGELANVAHGNGTITAYTYDGYGFLYKAEHFGANDSLLLGKYFIDAAGEVVREVRGGAGGQLVTSIDRNGAGLPTRVAEPVVAAPLGYPAGWNPAAAVHEFDYDILGRLVERRLLSAPGGSSDLVRRDAFQRDAVGRTYRHEVFEGAAMSASQVYTTLWEGVSKQRRTTGPGGRFLQATYDALARVVERRDSRDGGSPNLALSNRVEYAYVAGTPFVGRVADVTFDEQSATHVTRETEYVRDSLGRVLEIRQGPAGAQLVHRFRYYSSGPTESYEDPMGKVEQYLPDAMGRLVERFRPGAEPIWNGATFLDWLPSADATELLQVDGRGRETRTIFDFAGRAVVVMEPGAAVVPTSTDRHQPFARLLQYDAASRLTDVYAGDGVHVHIDRDGSGRMRSVACRYVQVRHGTSFTDVRATPRPFPSFCQESNSHPSPVGHSRRRGHATDRK